MEALRYLLPSPRRRGEQAGTRFDDASSTSQPAKGRSLRALLERHIPHRALIALSPAPSRTSPAILLPTLLFRQQRQFHLPRRDGTLCRLCSLCRLCTRRVLCTLIRCSITVNHFLRIGCLVERMGLRFFARGGRTRSFRTSRGLHTRRTNRTPVLRVRCDEGDYPACFLACRRLRAFGSSASIKRISSGKYLAICLSSKALSSVVTSS